MGVYIKSMEMPKEFDPDVYIELACGTDGERYARLYNFHQGGITEWCEAIHVPPHGRLIDADALDADLERQDMHTGEWDAVGFSIEGIRNAPAIIPAEEGE